jgi:tripartite-type tricarboxylate transporter receptor subunit TctC
MRITPTQSLSCRGALGLLLCFMAVAPASAAEFEAKMTRIVVPFAPGGGTGIIARTLAHEMANALGGAVIIENKPGAGTIIGTDLVAKAEPDGHTLLMATCAHAVNPSLRARLPYDTEKDFSPVSLIARSFNIVVVEPNSGFRSIADLVSAAKAKPNALNYGTFGPGTSAHLAGELFDRLASVKMTAVHNKGAAPAITDLLCGTTQVMFTTVASATSLIRDGKLKALAVTSATRVSAFPDVPTVAEGGVPGYAAESWYGLFAPANTPATAVGLVNSAVEKSIHSPAFDKLVENEGLIMVGGAPSLLADYVRAEEVQWRKVMQEAGIKVE